MRCPAEPVALTDEQIDVGGNAALDAWDNQVLLAGRGCRDALARVCRWHVERGMELPDGIRCG